MQKIVVGIDGSEGSKNALRWAIEEAGRRDATVEALHAWQAPRAAGLYSGGVYTEDSVREAGEKALDDAIAGADPGGSAKVERRCVTGHPAAALVEAGTDADLLVVGSRGLGGFSRLLIGSVSSQVAHHAPCPVVVVPTPL
jgi:nucleotide-binding universal stress UspA family protein